MNANTQHLEKKNGSGSDHRNKQDPTPDKSKNRLNFYFSIFKTGGSFYLAISKNFIKFYLYVKLRSILGLHPGVKTGFDVFKNRVFGFFF